MVVLDALVLANLGANLNDNSKGDEIPIKEQKAFKKANRKAVQNANNRRD